MLNSYCSPATSLAALLVLASLAGRAQAPAITSVVPAANARAVAPTASLTVGFDQPLPATAGPVLQVYSDQRGGRRTATTAATVSGNSLVYAPGSQPYQPGETVRYTVVGGGASGSGSPTTGRVGQFTVAASGTGRGNFQARQPVLAGRAAASVAVGDLNNDGRPDLVVTNYSGHTVSIHLQDASGNFVDNGFVFTYIAPQAPSLADLDGDGDLDLAFCNNTGSLGFIYVRLNDGAGNFSGTQQLPTDYDATNLTFGDVDADGDLDLLIANGTRPSSVWLYLNDGQANFGNVRPIGLSGIARVALALGDLDGDGDLDLAAVSKGTGSPGQLSIRLNDGHGVFTGSTAFSVGPLPNSLALGDVDGDGDLDVLTCGGPQTSAGTVSIRLNNGAAGFGTGTDLTVGDNPLRVVLGDVDADGDLDFVTANNLSAGTSSFGLNNGTGTFVLQAPIVTNFYPSDAALADIDSDGDLDLAVVDPQSFNVCLYLNGSWQPPVIGSVTPTAAVPGTTVTVTGSFLNGTNALTLNGTPLTGFVVNAAGTSLTFVLPTGVTSGTLGLTTPGGSTSYSSLCVQHQAVAPAVGRCGPGALTLTASGAPAGGSYAWYAQASGGTPLATGPSYALPALAASTSYYVAIGTGTGSAYCEGPRTAVAATIGVAPAAPAAPPGSRCSPGSLTLSASGTPAGGTYRWYDQATGGAPLGSAGSSYTTPSLSASATYYVSALSTEGCESPRTAVAASINLPPAAPTAVPTSRCGPGNLTLSASGAPAGGTYQWYDQATGGTALGGAGGSYTTPALTTNATYYVSVLSAEGCASPRTTVPVSIVPLPSVSIVVGGATTLCAGDSVTLTATGASTYQWSTGATTNSIRVGRAGSYTVVGTTAGGCAATSAATSVTVNPLPATPVITQNPAGALSSSAATGNQWYFNGTAVPGATGASYVVTSATGTGSYTVVTTSAAGCASAPSAAVAVVLGTAAAAGHAVGLQLWPNPSAAAVTVVATGLGATAPVQLFDALGRPVLSTKANAQGTAQFRLPAGLAPGLYLVRSGGRSQRLLVE